MNRFFALISLISFPVLLLAQSQQQVVVREYRDKQQKTPLEGVSLSVQNAGSSLSDAQGQLTLQFRTLKAGDQVQVRRVDLSGYEIFNQDAVDQWTISPQQAFSLVLCRSDRFKQLRDQYMRVSSASYERQYKQDQARLEALRKENKLQEEAYQQQLADLENNYYEQLDNLENYVDRFARIDLSELSAQEQRLVELVQEGKIDEAIQFYESADYLSQYASQVKDLKEINKAQAALAKVEAEKLEARDKVQAAISRQVQTYQLAGGRENFNKISVLLKGVADADTTNLVALNDYTKHCLTQNMFAEGEKYLNIYLRQCQGDKFQQARVSLNLGRLFGSKYVFDLAEKYEQQALALARECVAESEDNIPLLTQVLASLHTLYIYTNKPESALAFSEELESNFEKIRDNDDLKWNLSTFYGEYGIALYQVTGDIEKAEYLLLKSYALAKEIATQDQFSYDSMIELNFAINDINHLYYDTKQWAKMKEYVLEDIQLREKQYETNVDATIRYLLNAYNNASEIYYNLNQLVESHKYLNLAFNLLPHLSEIYDESSLYFDKMNLYDVASQLYNKEGDKEQSQKYAALCLECFERMPEELKIGLEELVQRNQEYLKP